MSVLTADARPAPGADAARQTMLLQFHWTVVCLSIFYALLSWTLHYAPGVRVMLLNAAIIGANIVYLRTRNNYVVASNIYLIVNCLVAITGSSYFSGGLYSPVTPWYATGPIAAVFLLGMNTNALLLTALNMLCIGAFAALAYLGIAPPVLYDPQYTGLFFATSLVGLVLTLGVLTQQFDRAKSRALQASEQSNLALREAMDKVEAAYQAKSRFLSAASHDLRQPAHALGMFVTRLAQLPTSAQHGELIHGIERSVHALQEMIDSYFDYTRLDAQAGTPTLRPVRVNDLVDQLRTLFDSATGQKRLRLVIRPSPLWVLSDATLLQRVLLNLVSNAIQYSPGGTVLVSCRPCGQGRQARLEVWDSGIGIAPHLHERIFEEFFQVGNPARDRAQGLGLGLNMVERSCKQLQHPLALRSQLGCGSRFSVIATRAPPPPPARPAAVPAEAVMLHPDVQGLQVLLVEDNALANAALCGVLESWGCTVRACSDAQQACTAVQHIRPDFVICDYRLPGEQNGIALIAQLRALAGQMLPACLISGDMDEDFRRQAAAADLLVLRKPIKPASLRSVLRNGRNAVPRL